MSADNEIAILVTCDSMVQDEKIANCYYPNEEGILSYRVAHVQGMDNLDWYEENQPYNVGAYLYGIFGKSKVYRTEKQAQERAIELHNEAGWTEYGITYYERKQYAFFGQ